MSTLRVVGLDLSLTSTGMAFVRVSDTVGVSYDTWSVTSKATSNDLLARSRRLGGLADKIIHEVLEFTPHVVMVEGPAPNQKSGHHHDRSGLWWLVVNILTNDGIPVMEVPPSTRAKYATGKGNAGKTEVVIAVTRRYPSVSFDTDDEADALVLAALGARLHGSPVETSMPKSNLEALKVMKPLEVVNA